MKYQAYGKLIISGEHAAVYGEPTIITQINKGVTAALTKEGQRDAFFDEIINLFEQKTKKIVDKDSNFIIESELPIGSGLGSSAAVAYGCFQALSHEYKAHFEKDDYLDMVFKSEKYMHGNPSGADAYAVVNKGLLSFTKTSTQPIVTAIHTDLQLKALLINSGKPKESTKEMVALVAQKVKQNDGLKNIFYEIGLISKNIAENFSNNTFDYTLIKQNQEYLQQLNVSSPEADSIINTVEKCGGVAKITGAGGNTNGSGMILAFHQDLAELKKLQEKFADSAYTITFPME